MPYRLTTVQTKYPIAATKQRTKTSTIRRHPRAFSIGSKNPPVVPCVVCTCIIRFELFPARRRSDSKGHPQPGQTSARRETSRPQSGQVASLDRRDVGSASVASGICCGGIGVAATGATAGTFSTDWQCGHSAFVGTACGVTMSAFLHRGHFARIVLLIFIPFGCLSTPPPLPSENNVRMTFRFFDGAELADQPPFVDAVTLIEPTSGTALGDMEAENGIAEDSVAVIAGGHDAIRSPSGRTYRRNLLSRLPCYAVPGPLSTR